MASNIRQILYAGLTHFIDRHTVFPMKYTQAFTVFCIHCILSYLFLDSCYFLRGGSEVSTGFVYDSYQTETEHSKARIVAILNGIRCLLSQK